MSLFSDLQRFSDSSERSCKSSEFYDWQFSEAEFVQAGLLPEAAIVLATPTSLVDNAQDPADSTLSQFGSPLPEAEQEVPTSTEAAPRHIILHSQQQTSQQQNDLRRESSNANDKKQANRDHQKKFRERRKVCLLLTGQLHSQPAFKCESDLCLRRSRVWGLI